MRKLVFLFLLVVLPGILATIINVDKQRRCNSVKNCIRLLFEAGVKLFVLITTLFLIDVAIIRVFFDGKYMEFLQSICYGFTTIKDVFEVATVWLVQVLLALIIGGIFRIVRYRSIEYAFFKITYWQRQVATIAFLGSLSAFLLCFGIKDNAEKQLVINEVCSQNNSILVDEYGDYRDYIELYNPSCCNISLQNFVLSDSSDFSDKIEIDHVVLQSKGHYLIWVGDSEYEKSGFSLNSEGENIYLLSSNGTILDEVEVPGLDANVAYARISDGAADWEKQYPSPSADNNTLQRYLEEPVFSAESGFYEEEFCLNIQANEGEKIYYTLDGSIPDKNAILYTEEILVKNVSDNPNVYRSIQNIIRDWKTYEIPKEAVDKAVIIRAIAIDDYGNTSDIVTKTYFVDMENYQDGYVLSIVSEPEELFGEDGIYVTGKEYDEWYLGEQEGNMPLCNFEKEGRDSEIETTIALFNNTLLMEQDAGMRIQGASQRHLADKRFSFFARKEYSNSRYFDYELFGLPMHSFFVRHDFEDAFLHSLVEDRSVGTLKAIPVSVFLNGEFWYNSYIREKYGEDYIALKYQVEKDTIRYDECVPEGVYMVLEGLDLSEEEDYQKFCDYMDMQSYIDYLAINIYLSNMDASELKNARLWKTRVDTGMGYSDSKFRWLLYDMDSLTWNSKNYYQCDSYEIDSFSHDKRYAGAAYNQEAIYQAVRVNEEFCKQFVLTFMDLANYNFSPEVVGEKMEAWGRDLSWNRGFFKYRYEHIVPALAKEFQLQGTLEEITISVNDEFAGCIQINTITPELKNGSWTGKYYTDYPVTLTAKPNWGYKFVGWTNGNEMLEEEQISVQMKDGGCSWKAVFQKAS